MKTAMTFRDCIRKACQNMGYSEEEVEAELKSLEATSPELNNRIPVLLQDQYIKEIEQELARQIETETLNE
jgi:hypothetical protein